ncbi:MAG TPA: S9 family peptidase [Gemmatimonadales bacterium]|nr:S9 family peptidase [Gemmatimonadales bacterium]
MRLAALHLPAALAVLAAVSGGGAQAQARRPLSLDDLARMRQVSEPRISPDGDWVSYTVTTTDTARDRNQSDVWMTSWDGSRTLQLTSSTESEHGARWSPDGRWLAFLSGRGDPNEVEQLWLLDRLGGEAARVTGYRGGVSDYDWAPDSRRLVLVVRDPPAGSPGDDSVRRPKPIVIDRYKFKDDDRGYLDHRRDHLYLVDLATRRGTLLTPGDFDDEMPSWSPDGNAIAFTSQRGVDPDRAHNWDVFLTFPTPGAEVQQLTTFEGSDGDPYYGSRPAWSPDGKWIAYLRGGDPKLVSYGVQRLAVVPSAGGGARVVSPELDRWVLEPRWSADGKSILFLLEDDRNIELARVALDGGPVERITSDRRVIDGIATGPGGKLAILSSTPDTPDEVYAVENGGTLRQLTHQNDAWLNEVVLGQVEDISFKSRDGTSINGLVMKPPGWTAGRPYPAILWLHGGPVMQFQHGFDLYDQLTMQWLATRGYVMIAPNPRGSSGRGEKFSSAVYADWGRRDAEDVLAAVDYAVRQGVADPQRLGIGGWSYGGILTNAVIAQDRRFKAATSGAGISNILAGYGTDEYIVDYETELGPPWKTLDTWLRLSFPFLHADRITTPTLFMAGTEDFNVPLLNSEQMYQALKSLGRDTQLIIYPGEHHTFQRPSFVRDVLRRYADWYDARLR